MVAYVAENIIQPTLNSLETFYFSTSDQFETTSNKIQQYVHENARVLEPLVYLVSKVFSRMIIIIPYFALPALPGVAFWAGYVILDLSKALDPELNKTISEGFAISTALETIKATLSCFAAVNNSAAIVSLLGLGCSAFHFYRAKASV